MDKQHAKFILQSYRPDGADASNPDFQEALQLAAADRDLGDWLAQERSQDAFFVEALAEVDIPESLRDEIFGIMEEGGMEVDMSCEIDAIFAAAMLENSPPPGLRDQIISAMYVESNEIQAETSNKIVKFPTRWLNIAAVAAVAALGFTFISSDSSEPGDIAKVDSANALSSEVKVSSEQTAIEQQNIASISMNSGKIINTAYELEMPSDSFTEVNDWFAKQGMPVAKVVPEALISYAVEGGTKITYDNGMTGSLISFDKNNTDKYYLMVVDLKSVKDADSLTSLSDVGLKQCFDCPMTNYHVTTWKDNNEAYILLTKSEKEDMMKMFF